LRALSAAIQFSVQYVGTVKRALAITKALFDRTVRSKSSPPLSLLTVTVSPCPAYRPFFPVAIAVLALLQHFILSASASPLVEPDQRRQWEAFAWKHKGACGPSGGPTRRALDDTACSWLS
jgi:hypothetical protein